MNKSSQKQKDLANDASRESGVFRLRERNDKVYKLFMVLEPCLQVAISFMSSPQVLRGKDLGNYKPMVIKMIEYGRKTKHQMHPNRWEPRTDLPTLFGQQNLPKLQQESARQLLEIKSRIGSSSQSHVRPSDFGDESKSYPFFDSKLSYRQKQLDTLPEETYQGNQNKSNKKDGDPLDKLVSIQLNEKLSDNMYKDIMSTVKDEGVEDYLRAVRRGDIKKVRDFLEQDPLLTVEVDDQMRTALHLACERGNKDMIKLLLEQGYNKVLLKAKDMQG